MRALTWHGKHNVHVDTVPDPQIVNPRDAIIKVTSTAICGSDLHLYDSMIPSMSNGDVLGHEFMGVVEEVGPKSTLQVGQRVIVPFVIACGSCFFCGKQQYSACDNSNPADKADTSEIAYGYPMSGLFGYSHMTGGYACGQAEYVRVPYSDVGPLVIPEGISSRATRSPSGAAGPSACSRSRALCCRARAASSPSITCPAGWNWPGRTAPRC